MGLVIDDQHFCECCNTFVDVCVRKEFEAYPINGELTWTLSNICHCKICGNHVWDNHLDQDNIMRMYEKYMKEHGLKSMDELRAFKPMCKMSETKQS